MPTLTFDWNPFKPVDTAPYKRADDTPMPMLSPGRGRTQTARFWAYLRDDRPFGGRDPPAVLYEFTPDGKLRDELLNGEVLNTLRVLSGPDDAARVPPAAMITKLYWATWHRDLGELAMDVLGAEALLGDQTIAPGDGYELTALQRLFLFTRSDTIYAGSNEIQRNIIGERALGLPKEPA